MPLHLPNAVVVFVRRHLLDFIRTGLLIAIIIWVWVAQQNQCKSLKGILERGQAAVEASTTRTAEQKEAAVKYYQGEINRLAC